MGAFPRLPAAFLIIALSWTASAKAQEPEPERDSSPLVQKPARTEQITISNFAIEANAVEDRLRAIDIALESTGLKDEVEEALSEVAAKGDALKEHFGSLSSRRMMNSEINGLLSELDLQEAVVSRQIDRVSRRAKEISALEEQNEADIVLWTQAVRDSRSPGVPPWPGYVDNPLLPAIAAWLKASHQPSKRDGRLRCARRSRRRGRSSVRSPACPGEKTRSG